MHEYELRYRKKVKFEDTYLDEAFNDIDLMVNDEAYIAKEVVTNVAGIADGTIIYPFVALYECHITKISLVCDTATSGSSSSKYHSFTITDELGAGAITTRRVTDANELAVDTLWTLYENAGGYTMDENHLVKIAVAAQGGPTNLAGAFLSIVVEYHPV